MSDVPRCPDCSRPLTPESAPAAMRGLGGAVWHCPECVDEVPLFWDGATREVARTFAVTADGRVLDHPPAEAW